MIEVKTPAMAAARLWLCGATMEDLRLVSGREDIEAVVRAAVVDAAEADGDEAAPVPAPPVVARPGKQRKPTRKAVAPDAPAGGYSQYPAKLRDPRAIMQRVAWDVLDEDPVDLAELLSRSDSMDLECSAKGDPESTLNSALYELKFKGLAERVGTRPATWRRA